MKLPAFASADQLSELIDSYFKDHGIIFENNLQIESARPAEKPWPPDQILQKAGAVNLSGLALYLGFNSLVEFEKREQKGKFSDPLKRARLRIEDIYGSMLLSPAPAGAIYAIKNMGLLKKEGVGPVNTTSIRTLKIKLIETGFKTAGSENEVSI